MGFIMREILQENKNVQNEAYSVTLNLPHQ